MPSQNSYETPDTLTEGEAAEFLRVRRRTVREWRANQGLPHFKINSRVVLYRRADLAAWLEKFRKENPVAERRHRP